MMELAAIPLPAIDPVAIRIGPLAVRWYALAYVAGLLLAVFYAKWILRRERFFAPGGPFMRPEDMDDYMLWAMLGVVLGGRLGYVLFYAPSYFVTHPADIVKLWRGGMSFHGGFLGVLVATWVFARRRGIPFWRMMDVIAAATPIGLLLGRVANFINGELWGRPTDVPWAIVFPKAGAEPRHPSQLYEAALEGVVLFVVLHVLVRRGALTRPGLVAGVFALGYGLSRFFVEFFREPDRHLGYLCCGWLTMGMVLSVPLMLIGAWLVARALRREPVVEKSSESEVA